MTRFLSAVVAVMFALGLGSMTRADEKEAKVVLDKAIKAIGGEEALSKVAAISSKGKGKIFIMENENAITVQSFVQGIDHYRGEFEGEFNGQQFKGVTVLNGAKGWRKFGEMDVMEIEGDSLANEKRSVYLQVVPILLTTLNNKGFKIESAADETVSGRPVSVIKATGPDGKDFMLYFDKESGLLTKLVAKVIDFMGMEFTQENAYSEYKDYGGIKRATKIEIKRDGEKFLQEEVTEFKVLEKLEADTFAEPK
jgi:hypothetical protein